MSYTGMLKFYIAILKFHIRNINLNSTELNLNFMKLNLSFTELPLNSKKRNRVCNRQIIPTFAEDKGEVLLKKQL